VVEFFGSKPDSDLGSTRWIAPMQVSDRETVAHGVQSSFPEVQRHDECLATDER
jgi:hypothetical protein